LTVCDDRRIAGAPFARQLLIAVLLLTTACIGCQTTNYTAFNLPQEFLAPPVTPTTDINLERLVGAGDGTSLIGPGDLVQITIVSGEGTERALPIPARVAQDGTVTVPLVGGVRVGGVDPIVAEQRIAAAAVERGIYRQPHVTLTVTEPAVNRVTVLGAVTKPGVVELPRNACDLASAIAAAGGLAKNASMQIEVMHRGGESFLADETPSPAEDHQTDVRLAAYEESSPSSNPELTAQASSIQPASAGVAGSPRTKRIDLAQVGPAGPQNHKLDDADVVMVQPKELRVIHVTGLVKKPSQFEVEDDKQIRVLDAIAMAGGTTSPVADKVFVIRQMPHMTQPAVIKVSIRQAKQDGNANLLLAANDLVSVENTAATMTVDSLNRFFRIALGGSVSLL
jgi:polysaccharide export outer membrane protein